MDGNVVSVERVIPAPADRIFAVIADPSQHPRFDGSGALQKARAGSSTTLALGDRFGMSMKMGLPYRMVNTVVEHEPDRRLAWKATFDAPVIGGLIGGRVWRYVLEDAPGGTKVTESWDISEDHQRALLRRGKLAEVTATHMERSLEQLEAIVTTD